MKKVKPNNLGRRILSAILTVALVVGLMPSNMPTVKAEESTSTPLSVTAFATPEQLMSTFDLDGTEDTVGKVYFGTSGGNPLQWYIAEKDSAQEKDNIVLFSAQALARINFGSNNTYAGSSLEDIIKKCEYAENSSTSKFTAAEDSLMLSTSLASNPPDGGSAKLYALNSQGYGDNYTYITAGGEDDIKIDKSYWGSNTFWLRAPCYDYNGSALVADPGKGVDYYGGFKTHAVVPAFNLNLSSVLFASAAKAATAGASLTDTMTFRVDGDDEITSKAYYTTDSVMVSVADKETVYLYVQGNDGTTDWVYSQELSADSTIATDTIKSGAKNSNGSVVSLTSVDLSQCKIWIEKKEDNLVYAVTAKEIETGTVITVAIRDITAPVAGAELDVAATCNTTGVSTTAPPVSYTKNGESVSGNAEGYLAGYTATVELEAAVGYAFTNETTATINGNEASVSYDADTGKLTVSYTFKTAKLPLGNAYYVTKDELMSSFDLDGTDDTVGKVYFGTNGSNKQTWYIAGSDAADSIVLLCDPSLPMATGTMFENDGVNNKTYSADWRCTYETAPNEVYPNHYGASDLRGVLQGYTSNDNTEKFSAAEKELMQSTKVYTDDDKRKDEGETDYTYYTEDVLYPAYVDYSDDQYITVGANRADSLNGGLKVSLKSEPYSSGNNFWLRAPYCDHRHVALVAYPGNNVGFSAVNGDSSVVPAFRLNLSSVLFASAATTATSDASLTDTLTFRVDDTEKIKSKAAYATCGVTVNYDEGDGNVFLYVQDADSVYSVEITEDTIVALSDMTGINNLTDENTKIWLEKSEDNVAYAVMAEALLTEHIPNADDGDCTTAITCSICGTVTTEAKENHIDDNGDGICDHCDSYVEPKQEDEYYQIANANNLMWFAQQVNEGQTTINAKLTADIDMKDIDWTIMNSFAGTFDGDGHTISGLNGHRADTANTHGFIRTLADGGVVKNLTFTEADIWNHEGSGAISAVIVYTNNGTVENCVVKSSLIQHGNYDALGVVVGVNGGTIRNCASISNTMTRRFSSPKDICGFVWSNSGSIENCFNYDCTYQNGSNRYAFTQSNTGTITNCYYYESSETISNTVPTAKTADQFASGEITYLLNGSSSENVTWYQKLLTDTYPVLDSKHGTVYSVSACNGTTVVYSNVNENGIHIDDNANEYCDICNAIYNGIGAHLAGYSVSLNGSIGVNFHMDLTQDVLDDNEAYMLFTLPNGTSQKVMVSDAKAKESTVIEGKTYYIFTCNVAAKEMTDTIQAQLITSDGSKTQVYKYSVREYAEKILSGSYDYETKELVKAMLHYGAYSQEWFDYNTTNLANNGLDTLDLSEANDWDEFNPSISNDEKVGSFTSAYLTLESDTAINLKFKLADGVSFEDLRVVVADPMGNVVPVTTDTTENVCLITLTGIKASDLDTTYDFSVTDGKGNGSYISYSAMSYACAVANSEMDQKLKNVTAALRIFNLRANEKFKY